MSRNEYRVVADIAEGHQMVGPRWETRFIPAVISTEPDYAAAAAAADAFRARSRGGEGKTFRNVRVLGPGESI